jgi:diguanylate cyclase
MKSDQGRCANSAPADIDIIDAIHDGARLAALRGLDLLDSAPDEEIDRFTRLAAETLGVPVSLVSLLDSDRQFFAGHHGLGGIWATDRQTPFSHSFCKYVVATKQTLVVEDARRDAVLSRNLAVRDLGVLAYAGVPLVLADGNAVGALCAIDHQPRHWTEHELAVLEDLAACLRSLLDMRAALNERGLHDRLTGLPNRDLLVAYCDQLLERSGSEELMAVMCVGIDSFAQINQALGAREADKVLEAVAHRLGGAVRRSDVFGRLRGDVFTLLAPGVTDEAEILTLAGRLREALAARPIQIGGEALWVGATVGIAAGRSDDSGPDLIAQAAHAMREAKQRRDRIWVSDASGNARASSQLRLRDGLRRALDAGEIYAAFQPVVALDGGQVRAFEALARWNSTEFGEVSPAEFIPIAELTGDIIPLGERMLELAAEQVAAWRVETDPDLCVGVNVSPLQLEQSNFGEVFADTLSRFGLPGEAFGIEITEGGLLETGEIQLRNLREIKRLGTRIALDDFGTGYSALSYLRHFPIDTMKIDRCFIETLGEDRVSTSLVRAILAMASGMEMQVVAEGIETEEQADLLRELGCLWGQGFLFGRPAAVESGGPV